MADDYDFPNLTLHGRLTYDQETLAAHGDNPEGRNAAAQFELGVDVNGYWLPLLIHRSASDILAAVQAAQDQQAKDQAAQQSSASGGTVGSTGTTGSTTTGVDLTGSPSPQPGSPSPSAPGQ